MSESLRSLALLAKKRLNTASKQKQKTKVDSFILYDNLHKHNYTIMVISQDDTMYNKVCSLLDENFDNPFILAQLVNNDEFVHLSEESKSCYMLKLVDEYAKLRARYINEHLHASA